MEFTGLDSEFSKLETDFRLIVTESLRLHAFYEFSASLIFEQGLRFVDDPKISKFIRWHITEEQEHYHMVADLFKTHAGQSLEPWVQRRVETNPLPRPESFLDLGLAQWLFDLSGNTQMENHLNCSWTPYRAVVEKICEAETAHIKQGREIALRCASLNPEKAQISFELWLKQAVLCFGPPNTPRDQFAVDKGFKRWTSTETTRIYLDSIRGDAKDVGLKIPKELDRRAT